MDIKRASIYCRGSDLAFQAGIAAAFITDHQLECWNIYVDEQGIDSWQKLTADCARGYTDVIIIKSIDVITEDKLDLDAVRAAIAEAPGCRLYDEPSEKIYPMPLLTSNQDTVYVGRIREIIRAGDLLAS